MVSPLCLCKAERQLVKHHSWSPHCVSVKQNVNLSSIIHGLPTVSLWIRTSTCQASFMVSPLCLCESERQLVKHHSWSPHCVSVKKNVNLSSIIHGLPTVSLWIRTSTYQASFMVSPLCLCESERQLVKHHSWSPHCVSVNQNVNLSSIIHGLPTVSLWIRTSTCQASFMVSPLCLCESERQLVKHQLWSPHCVSVKQNVNLSSIIHGLPTVSLWIRTSTCQASVMVSPLCLCESERQLVKHHSWSPHCVSVNQNVNLSSISHGLPTVSLWIRTSTCQASFMVSPLCLCESERQLIKHHSWSPHCVSVNQNVNLSSIIHGLPTVSL